MASIIRIKRSGVSGNPQTLAAGELAYSSLTDNGSNGGDRLYIGVGNETNGNAANHIVIGGKYFTDILDHAAGTLTASSAIIVDANSKINNLKVDNIDIDGNTISSTDTNGNITITPNGTGSIVLDGQNWPQADGTADYYLKTNGSGQLSWAAIPSGSFTLAADSGTPDTFTTGNTLTFAGTDPIDTTVTDNTITISAKDATTSTKGVASFSSTYFSVTSGAVSLNTEAIEDIVGAMVSSNTESGIAVTYDDDTGKLNFDVNDPTITIAGDVDGSATMTNLGNTTITVTLDTVNNDVGSFGSGSAIPVITVNGKGLVTAVTTAGISTSFSLAGDTGTDTFSTGGTLTFTGTDPVNTAVTNDTVTISVSDATTTTKGIASFDSNDFDVASGAVSLEDTVVKSVVTDSGTLTPSGHTFSLIGGEGMDVTHSTTTITIAGEDATTSNKGIASFNSASFAVTSGDVTIKSGGVSNSQLANSSVTVGSTSIALGATSTSLAGLTELTVDNININGNEISSTNLNGDIVFNPSGTGTVDVSGARIAGVGTPTQATDAATKGYVDAIAEGLHVHASVAAATTNTLSALTSGGTVTYDNGTSGVGATLTLQNALTTLDGYTLQNNDRILVKDQVNKAHNGIYIWATGGTILTRATDFDSSTEIQGGDFVFVTNGSLYNSTGWVQTDAVTTVGTTDVNFEQFSGAGTYIAGDGLTLTGSTFSVNVAAAGGIEISADALQLKSTVAGNGLTLTSGVLAVGGTADRITVGSDAIDIASTYVGQASITTLGTVTTGTWSATAIGTTKGGTGLTSYATGDLIYASATDTLAKRTIGTEGQVLQVNNSGVPVWGDIDGGTY